MLDQLIESGLDSLSLCVCVFRAHILFYGYSFSFVLLRVQRRDKREPRSACAGDNNDNNNRNRAVACPATRFNFLSTDFARTSFNAATRKINTSLLVDGNIHIYSKKMDGETEEASRFDSTVLTSAFVQLSL